VHRNQVKFGHLKHGARFTKYLTATLRLSCDNVKDAIDVRRTSIICGFDDCGSILDRVLMLLTSVVGDAAIHLIVQTMRLWSQWKEFFLFPVLCRCTSQDTRAERQRDRHAHRSSSPGGWVVRGRVYAGRKCADTVGTVPVP